MPLLLPSPHIMAMPVTLRRFRVEDLDRFPDDGNRYELVDGVLFVTPAPQPAHEELISRLMGILRDHLRAWPEVRLATRSEVVRLPDTRLEPDLQVYRAETLPASWADVRDRWLAVEVASRTTRMYDREYKRDAFLQMGVREVWLVDRFDREIRVGRGDGSSEVICRVELVWTPPTPIPPLRVEVPALFHGLPEDW